MPHFSLKSHRRVPNPKAIRHGDIVEHQALPLVFHTQLILTGLATKSFAKDRRILARFGLHGAL